MLLEQINSARVQDKCNIKFNFSSLYWQWTFRNWNYNNYHRSKTVKCVGRNLTVILLQDLYWQLKNYPREVKVEKAMAPYSSTLAWKIPWAEEPGRLQSMGSLRVRQGWATSLSLFTFMHWRRKWQPTPVFLPGESQGLGEPGGLQSMGLHRVRHDWSDLAAAATAAGKLKRTYINVETYHACVQKIHYF